MGGGGGVGGGVEPGRWEWEKLQRLKINKRGDWNKQGVWNMLVRFNI